MKRLNEEDNGIKPEDMLLERLAELEHQQWIEWSKAIAGTDEKISEDRLDKWAGLWIPYKKLSDENKEKDRVWARKVIEVINKQEYIKQRIKEAKIDQCKFDTSNINGMNKTLKNALAVSKEQERNLRKIKEMFKKLLISKFNKAVKEIEKSELKCYDEQDVMNLLDDILEALE